MSNTDSLRGHAFYLELVGKSGGPSPWWLVLLAAVAIALGIAQDLGIWR